MKINNKPVIMEIDNVAIVRDNRENLAIYRLENVYSPFDKKNKDSWQFKGFYSSVSACLEAIQYKELLINENDCASLERYLKQVQESNEKLIRAMEVSE